MISIDCYAHIPGIKLVDQDTIVLGNYRLASLSFEEWFALEDPCFCEVERRYQQNAPVFFHNTLTYNDLPEFNSAFQSSDVPFTKYTERLSLALFLCMGISPPDPARSVLYFKDQNTGLVMRKMGINEREFIFTPYDNTETIESIYKARLEKIFVMLTRYKDHAYTEITRVIEAYKTFRLPQLTSVDGIVHVVAAFEDILNRQSDKPLGQTFAKRGGFLFAPTFDAVSTYIDLFKMLYSLRSDTLHGTDVTSRIPMINGASISQFIFFLVIQMCSFIDVAIRKYSADISSINMDKVINELTKELDSLEDNDVEIFNNFRQNFTVEWLED